jgi:ABC-type branched-subunit amino acid transport system ATPase component
VKAGETLGIIGRNGAGKSTLLKILSRITEPTRGRIAITGRVASLLEVGTGFHMELTGRQNIYLNGAILGMTRQEIKRKFDEIVAFAEVESFLDTPVKRYSSGMSCAWLSPWRPIWNPRSSSSTRCLLWAMQPFRRNASARWATWPRREGPFCS